MTEQELLSGMLLELRRGTIVLCVLGSLKAPRYGYDLVSRLNQQGVSVEANTLYPLLRRLESQGLLISSWETSGAKPRKYYNTTELGNHIFEALQRNWNEMVEQVNLLMEGNTDA